MSIDAIEKNLNTYEETNFQLKFTKNFIKIFHYLAFQMTWPKYLTVVDQVMPYEEGFKSSANQKWLLKKYFTDSHKSVWNTATGFLHSNCQVFNGQIFDFSRKIASMYYFSNLAYALLLHIVVKSCQLSNLKARIYKEG